MAGSKTDANQPKSRAAHLTPHLFQPGQSGNPGGRPKKPRHIEELAREHTPAALEALVAALKNPRERVAAAIALLDRGWGKPKQALEHSGSLEVSGGIDAPARPATVEDAEQWLERRRRELAALN